MLPLSVSSLQQLLKDSIQLQERLSALQSKRNLLGSVFGPEESDSLHQDLSAAIRNRELLHSQLLQRKSRLQVTEGDESLRPSILKIPEKHKPNDLLEGFLRAAGAGTRASTRAGTRVSSVQQ